MAPKKKKVVVKTTRKVVQETVEVAVVDNNEDLMQVARDELGRGEIIDSRGPFQERVKIIVVEDKSPETVQKAGAQDDSETQPAEEEPEQKEQTDTQETEDGTDDQAYEATEKEKEQKEEKTGLNKRRKKRRGRRGERGRREGYKIYVFRVLKQVHPGMGISSKAVTVLNNLMTDMFERLADEATRLSKYSGKTIISSREIQGAVKLVLPGDLGKHAIAEGAKAISTFMSYDTNKF